MEKRRDKLTGKAISLLGFGTMRLPYLNGQEDLIDRELGEKMVDYAYNNGVNYFDTAYPYHRGKAEYFIGEALKKYPRDSFFLADKMPPWALNTREDVSRVFEKQFKKCQVDYFDYYLCHNLNKETIKPFLDFDVVSYLNEQKKAGRIRHLGFSFHDSPDFLEKVVDLYDWDFAQIQLNYMDWEMQDAKRQYEILTERNIPVIVMEPVRGGALAALGGRATDMLLAADGSKSIASWAIRYAATLPNVMTVLSGMSNMEQVVDNIATMSEFKPLSQRECDMLYEAAEIYRKDVTIACTGCRYCMDCPQGVDIPEVFAIYNKYSLSKNKRVFLEDYAALLKEKQAESCIGCGQCVAHCPQQIAISQRMTEISGLIASLK